MPLTFDAQGLIPAIVQDAATGEVLTVAYINRDALRKTVESGQSWFWSRSRGALWHKGETSGNYQDVVEMRLDCDGDALLFRVKPAGPACHTGASSCFFGKLEPEAALEAAETEPPLETPGPELVDEVFQVVLERQRNRPPGSYVAGLLDSGIDGIARKVGEEAIEVVIAAKNGDSSQLVWEVADLWFHSLVLLAAKGLKPSDIWAEFQRRRT